jgi:hypothetical protein
MSLPNNAGSIPQVVPARASSRFRPLAAALVAVLAVGCIGRTLGNQGLEAIPAPVDPGSVGNMIVSPSAAALGERILRFDNRGTTKERAVRRKGAEQSMAAACASPYRSGAEGPTAVNGVVTAAPDETTHDASEFWYVQFVCVRDQRSAAAGG